MQTWENTIKSNPNFIYRKGLNVCDYLPETYVISKGLNDP